jgi:hypothetical protein
MPGVRHHLDQQGREPGPAGRPSVAPDRTDGPAITAAADPRLAHGTSGAAAGLMHVQRTAGNAAVSSLVGPTVQRGISIDEVDTQATAPTTGDSAETAGGDAEAAGDHTITAAHIGLNAPMVEAPGVIRAQTVIADSIVAASYTPGAGNEW